MIVSALNKADSQSGSSMSTNLVPEPAQSREADLAQKYLRLDREHQVLLRVHRVVTFLQRLIPEVVSQEDLGRECCRICVESGLVVWASVNGFDDSDQVTTIASAGMGDAPGHLLGLWAEPSGLELMRQVRATGHAQRIHRQRADGALVVETALLPIRRGEEIVAILALAPVEGHEHGPEALGQFDAIADALTSAIHVLDLRESMTTGMLRNSKQMEEIAVTRDLLRNVIDSSSDFIFVKDRDLRTMICNHAFAWAIGATTDSMVGKTDLENGWPEALVLGDPQRGIRGFAVDDREVLAGKSIQIEAETVTVEGQERIFSTSKTPLRDVHGAIIGVLGVGRDITESRLAAQRTEQILAAMPVPVAVNDAAMRIVSLNPAFEACFGYARAEIPTVADWWPKAYPDPQVREQVVAGWMERLEQARRTGTAFEPMELVIRKADGSDVTMMVSAAPIGRDWTGSSVVVFTDVTTRRATEEALRTAKVAAERASQAKTEFLAMMSHELRTPMNGVMGMNQLLLMGTLSDVQREFVETSQQCAESLLKVINNVLDYTRIESRRMELSVAPFHLARAIQEIVGLLTPRDPTSAVKVDVQWPADVDTLVLGDEVRIRQILVHLIRNAITYTPRGRVVIAVALKEGLYCIAVSDTGVGIPEDRQGDLFIPFNQLDGTINRNHDGMGIGLTISRRLAELMGGSLDFVSSLGKGSCFTVKLPLVAVTSQSAQPPEIPLAKRTGNGPEPSPTKKQLQGHVLLVEDDHASQLVGHQLILQHGLTCDIAANGHEALIMLAAGRYDCVLMDCKMPVKDGYETTRAIREWESLKADGVRIPVIAVTANALPQDRVKCLDAGMDDYLATPIRHAALLSVFQRWLPGKTSDTVS